MGTLQLLSHITTMFLLLGDLGGKDKKNELRLDYVTDKMR